MKKLKLNSGFTIIEVVLVLAIAGLIFLMVFFGSTDIAAFAEGHPKKTGYFENCGNFRGVENEQ